MQSLHRTSCINSSILTLRSEKSIILKCVCVCRYGYNNDTFVKQAPLQHTPKLKAPLGRSEIKWKYMYRSKLMGNREFKIIPTVHKDEI